MLGAAILQVSTVATQPRKQSITAASLFPPLVIPAQPDQHGIALGQPLSFSYNQPYATHKKDETIQVSTCYLQTQLCE